MNFHKTIGYLAALLLMVGLGAPDSFAQTVKVSKIEPADYVRDQSRLVTITVDIEREAVDDGTTVTVTVELPDLPNGVAITVTRPDPE